MTTTNLLTDVVNQLNEINPELVQGSVFSDIASDIGEGAKRIHIVCEDGSEYVLIDSGYIDQLLEDELTSDPYMLGSFRAEFIQECTQFPIELIEACQNAGAYSALGQAIINAEYAGEMADRYTRYDGYGAHFASYDGYEYELCLGGSFVDYHVFRVN